MTTETNCVKREDEEGAAFVTFKTDKFKVRVKEELLMEKVCVGGDAVSNLVRHKMRPRSAKVLFFEGEFDTNVDLIASAMLGA